MIWFRDTLWTSEIQLASILWHIKHQRFLKKEIGIYKRDVSCSLHGMNQRNLNLVSASYKILSSIHLARLNIDQITGNHQCRSWCNKWTADKIFCTHQISEKDLVKLEIHFRYLQTLRDSEWLSDDRSMWHSSSI